jgi:acyl-coenzyme A thioesterase PaaI-like protein
MDASFYAPAEGTAADQAESDRVFGALTQAVRALSLAQLQTRVDLDEVEGVTEEITRLTERLNKRIKPGSYGTEISADEKVRNYGNSVVGMRNPFAAMRDEARIVWNDNGASAEFHLNALYEGPPGLVHGGVSALILDQLLGEAAAAGGGAGMTGRLTLHYRRPTPLGDLSMEAWVEKRDGIKTIVKGHIKDAEGNVTVEAEGLFIMPRWARELLAEEEAKKKRPNFE